MTLSMLLQHRPSVRAQHPLCPELGFPFASATFQLHGLLLLPPRNSLWCISGLLRIEMPEGLRSAALWPVAEGRRAQFWDLCALGPPGRSCLHSPSCLFCLAPARGTANGGASKRSGEASRNASCSLAGSRPFWRDEEQLQMHVRKQRANVDSFTGAGVVGKAH